MSASSKSNIVLIGMPGVGKSTVGVVLAKLRGMHFIDTDLIIQEQTGRLLDELIEESGVDGFVALEDRIVSTVDATDTVISTGGSVVYGAQAMHHLASQGTVVFIDCAFDEIERRLGSWEDRGVAVRPGQSLHDLYEERSPLYRRYAEVRIDATGLDVRQTVLALSARL
jgi:shikimate kinase